MRWTRRAFLRGTGLALTTLGVREIGLTLLSDRYQAALAQPTNRKLALLIGINQYPEQVCDYVPSRGSALNGCIADVHLQKELLIHRFGFQAANILTLTDQQATRQAIAAAFQSHLVEQTQPDDVVVVHFSGLGSRVRLTDAPDQERTSLVPVDGWLPTEDHPAIHDLLDETVELLLRSLPTTSITTVFDLSYADPAHSLQGSLRVRSRPTTPTGELSADELDLQERLLSQVKTSREQIRAAWGSGQSPGVVLTAAARDQGAIEGQWGGFSAGLFTYALTQHLWQTTPATTLRIVLGRASGTMNQLAGGEQQPQLQGQKSHEQRLLAYYLPPTLPNGCDGVVTALEDDGKTVQLWMGGLPAPVLDYYGVNALLSLDTVDVLEPTGLVRSLPLQVRSRDGLVLKAKLVDADSPVVPQVGQPVRETVRLLPRNISLIVALDTSLERIERVDATSAFASIPRVSTVVAGEQSADYLFGKTRFGAQTLAASLVPSGTGGSAETPSRDLISKGSYGLFNLGRGAIPNTLTQEDEAVKTAINRLTPQLRTLLATKLVRLTTNSGSSRLGVRATLEMVAPQERIILQQETVRAPWLIPEAKLPALFAENDGLPTVPVGSRIRYRLLNYSDRPVYFTMVGLNPDGRAAGLFMPSVMGGSVTTDGGEGMGGVAIAPGETLTLPQSPNADWGINGSIGLVETHLIFSRTPLTQTTAVLAAATHPGSNTYRMGLLPNPLEVTQALLQDLHEASLATSGKPEGTADTYSLDVNAWATLSLIYEVVQTA